MNKNGINVVACIVVRMKSTRLPKKAIADINGKPMTLRLIERLRMAKTINRIVICTSTHPDDSLLIDYAHEWEIDVFAGSEEDVLSRFIQVMKKYSADIIIRVTGDNVLTDPNYIDLMVERHITSGADYTRTNGLPLGITAEIMSGSMLIPLHNLIPDPNQSEYMMLYAFDPDHFHCEVIDAPSDIKRPFYSLSVDTPKDLEVVRKIYSNLPSDNGGPTLKEIIQYLDNDSEYQSLSKDIPVKMPDGSSKPLEELLVMLEKRAERSRRNTDNG